jgi:hypothetical protein
MANVIVFHIPESFRKKSKWVPAEERGKLLQFPAQARKSA